MKLVLGIADVRAFKAKFEQRGMELSAVHVVDGVEFVNTKDPAGNSIQISSRGMR